MEKTFRHGEQVVVKFKHLNGPTEIKPGEIVSVGASTALVAVQGEDKPRTYPLNEIQSSPDLYGDGANFDNAREMPVAKMYPKHML